MKKFILVSFLISVWAVRSFAQDVTLPCIPYPLVPGNGPMHYDVIGRDRLKMVATAQTDLFISPDGGFIVNKSPRLLFRPDSSFVLTAKISPDFGSKWDAGVLLLYNDSSHFAKFCFESDYTGQPRIVTVVCNNTGDDCNGMPITEKSVYYRVAGNVRGRSFAFYYSSDGSKWFLIRAFHLDRTNDLRIGFSAQSPSGKQCAVDFSGIRFDQRTVDFWSGN